MKRPQILLRQPNLIVLSGPPDVARHAAGEALTAIVDLAVAFTAVVSHVTPHSWHQRKEPTKMKPPIKTLVVEGESGDIFVVANGVKIAKRGHPGTPHAETWVPLEAGWTVIDCEGGSTIEVTYEGVRIH